MSRLSQSRVVHVAAILLLFTIAGAWRFRRAVGEDLSSSYVGCRVLAAGQADHLYAHDPKVFTLVEDPVWNDIAKRANFAPLALLHPYVQTPLWAYVLQPVCTQTHFRTFLSIFLVLAMLCTSGTIWLVAHHWVPALFHPIWILLICAGVWFADPFRYAMFLAQTHILFVFLSVLALILAQRNRPVWAGLSLAVAATVKISPGFLLIYWLASRRYKAAGSFVGFSILLAALTIVASGPTLFIAYLHELSALSNVLLVAFNNQSLAAWWMGHHYPASERFKWNIYPLPLIVKLVSLALSVVCAFAGGMLDRNGPAVGRFRPPYGAVFAMVASTLFTVIAWNHYSVLLIIPLMLLLGAMLDPSRWSRLWGGLAAVVYLLNVYPVSYGSIMHFHQRFSIARSEFYACVICLLALVLLHRLYISQSFAGDKSPVKL